MSAGLARGLGELLGVVRNEPFLGDEDKVGDCDLTGDVNLAELETLPVTFLIVLGDLDRARDLCSDGDSVTFSCRVNVLIFG